MPEIFVAPQKGRPEEIKKKNITQKEEIKKEEVKNEGIVTYIKTALAAFVSFPKDIRFENQEGGEKVILLLRRHWVTNVSWLFLGGLMFVAPIFIFPTISYFKFLSFIPIKFQAVFLIFWYLVTFSFLFVSFVSWYFNVYIVTNKRIIDVDFFNLLYKEVSSCYLSKVQDVTYQVGGSLKILFDYGNVLIQTAGKEKNLEFEQVPKPAEVARITLELMGKKRKNPEK